MQKIPRWLFEDKPKKGKKVLKKAGKDIGRFQLNHWKYFVLLSHVCINLLFSAGESEDIHWGQWQDVAWKYFRKTYPDPIGNPDAEKLFAFILGVTSHQVADVSWHSLEGLRDGMITMLSQTSYNGQWQTAHSYADFVGDIVGIMEWNTTYANEW